jgi:signal transduction histidine kinase/ligand-binding sensor domain-containing protein
MGEIVQRRPTCAREQSSWSLTTLHRQEEFLVYRGEQKPLGRLLQTRLNIGQLLCFVATWAGRSGAGSTGLILLLSILSLACPRGLGQANHFPRQRIIEESWTFRDGAPEQINSLAQTRDGFLWLGCSTGLFRFDGTHFQRFHPAAGEQLLSTNVYALFAPPTGGLWVGYTFGGFSFVDHGRVKNYGGPIVATTGTIKNFAQDRDGTVWAADNGGLWRFQDARWQPLGAEWNAPRGTVDLVALDRSGTLWVIAAKKLFYLRPGSQHFRVANDNLQATCFTLDAHGRVITRQRPPQAPEEKEYPDYPVLGNRSSQIVDRNGSVWIMGNSLTRVASIEQLQHLPPKLSPHRYETYNVNAAPAAGIVDREGNVWFGDDKGLYQFFYSPLMEQKLPSEQGPFAIAADKDGAIWAGSWILPSRLYHLENGRITTHFVVRQQVRRNPSGWTISYRAPDQTIWLGGGSGLWHLADRRFVGIQLPAAMIGQGRYLQAITADRGGGLWVSFGRHGLYRWTDGRWTSYAGRAGLPRAGVVTAFTDRQGRVWLGYTGSQLAVLDQDRVRIYGPGDGVQVGNITALYGRGPELWIGGEFGLQQFADGRFHTITAVDGDWLRGIAGIVETSNGDLWLNGLAGIFHIGRAEIAQAIRNPAYAVLGEHFGPREGLPGTAEQVRPLASAIQGSDGRLWFAEISGLVWLDPIRHAKQVSPPPITLQSVTADEKSYGSGASLTFPAHTASVQITYAAVSLSDPEAIRFRYKLQETDAGWHEVSTATPVTYRNLIPGTYHFRVEASDTNGSWTGRIAEVEFTLLPAWYQTTWALVAATLAVLALLWGIYRLRVRGIQQRSQELAAMNAQLEVQISERQQAEESLRQAQADLTRANRVSTMGELTASLAHEVNQPIAAAITDANTCLRWLSREQPDLEEARAAAARIVQAGRRAGEIIKRVRLLFKKDAQHAEPVDLNEIIREMTTLLHGEATQFAIAVRTKLAAELPAVMGDRVQLQQVLMNLMMNSIDAMKDADGPRELTIESQRRDDGQVLVAVSDTGMGLPPQQADRIFDAFFTTKNHGTGMGLRISLSIVEAHGGRLWAADNSPRGAKFCFTLPASHERPDEVMSGDRAEPEAGYDRL